ncbi:MAG: hypothetical protein JNL87_22725 [Burkholderiaceae bacterium]|nr:hypothetical protein [Burkholderiaceae bacterium]
MKSTRHRRLLPSLRRLSVAACALVLATSAASAQDNAGAGWSRSLGPLELRGGIDTYSAYYAMRGTWWNLAASSAPTFDMDRSFAELWMQPKLDGRYKLGNDREAYASLSVGATQTLGSDAFDYRNEGEVRFGSAALGLRGKASDWTYDVSFGRQPFTLGTGMLLTAGSSNGYSWGGGASAQRKTWGRSLVARAGTGEWTGTAFALEPDEAPEARTETRVQGVALEWARPQMGKAGLAWFTSPRSQAIYPGDLAPLVFIEKGREGLDTWHGWADITGLLPALPTLGFRAEFAQQRNDITRADGSRDPMKASAWLVGASWWAQDLPFAPKFTYHVARFTGDKPDTPTYERFDPMFWGNGLENWWFGANGAYSWLNANLRARRFIVDAYLSAQDILQFQYVRAEADQLNSAVQFGQGVSFTSGGLVVGVPQAELSDEFYLQYARVFNPKLIAIAFVSRSNPGAGLKANAPQGTTAWTTLGVGLTANF